MFGANKYAVEDMLQESFHAAASWTALALAPLSGMPGLNKIHAQWRVAAEASCAHGKPNWDIPQTVIDGKTFAVSDKVILEKPFCNIVHFECEGAPKRPELLLFAPLSGHHATLLRDTVKGLLPKFDVSITDWVDAKQVPLAKGEFGLHDYINYCKDFIGALKPDTVMAVCQPGPALAAALALREQEGLKNPRAAIFMGSPIDVDAAPTEVTRFANKHSVSWFKENVVQEVPTYHPGAGQEVYPGKLQLSAFVMMNLESHIKKHMQQADNIIVGNAEAVTAHNKFYGEYLSVLDMPSKFYLETLKHVFGVSDCGTKDRSLAEGKFEHEGKLIDFSRLTKTSILVVEGEKDDICAPGQTKALHALCSNLPDTKKDYLLVPNVGHYGIFSGESGWRKIVVPKIEAFVYKTLHLHGHAPANATLSAKKAVAARASASLKS